MSQQPVAQCCDVHHAYGATPALDGIDLELAGGQVTALLGPNGAGKTTLIHLLLGLLPVQRGSIRVFGDQAPSSITTRRRIGTMLQSSGVQDNLTVRELINLFASFYPEPMQIGQLIEETRLNGLEQRRFDRLSGGQKQRVLFALAAVGQPDWLILDEPTTGLDPAARRTLWQAIEARREAGVAILLCTHFMDEAQKLADHVVVLDRGRIVHSGTPDAIRRTVPRDRVSVRTRLELNAIRSLAGVVSAQRTDETTMILSSRGIDTVRALLDADASIDDLEVTGADLETAFLSLTDPARAESSAIENKEAA